ncbi:MAG: hypothetical protein MUO50_13265 [Longimicrobiales bacterium]|nr:hypothetical protein [Longimicrobiales bacterium]
MYQGRFNWGMGGILGLGLGGLVGADLAAGGELNPSKTESYIGFLVGGAIGAAVGNGFGARKYVLIGAGVGTLVGAAGWGGKDDMSVILVPAGFVAGAAVGSLIGFIRGMNRWKEVRLPLTPAEFYRTPDGRFGVSLSIPLWK